MARVSVHQLGIDFPIMTRGIGAARGLNAPARDDRIVANERGRPVFRALDDVSFKVNAGDRLALVGPNGAGKSTLLLALAGIYAPTAGTIAVDGRLEALFNPRLGFKPEATGRRNVILRGLVQGWSRAKIEQAVDDIVDFAELGSLIDMPLRSYSQGMAARLAFATSTAFAPDILLMDEWIGAGDKSFQAKAADRMKSFIDKTGIVIIASHNDGILRRLCNKAIRLKKGHVAEYGPIDNVIPQTGNVGKQA
ncbi:ABC transporter ATP-binding protein [Oricola sp.]|uniref:ABC transporter ATP-binding protein n=1 Tax=Oricola sp. TaxID=1979950 RepID=UPI003BAA7EA2